MKKLLAFIFSFGLFIFTSLPAMVTDVQDLGGGQFFIEYTYQDDNDVRMFQKIDTNEWYEVTSGVEEPVSPHRAIRLETSLQAHLATHHNVAAQAIQAPQAQQALFQRLASSAKNLFLRWGLPVRLDVGPQEALQNEYHRATAAWNGPALRTFFILLGEVTAFFVFLSISNSLGSYSGQVSDHLIPSFNTLINPDGMLRRHTYGGVPRFHSATRLDGLRGTGESLLCLCLMPLIQSYIVVFGIHSAEDLFCSIGRVTWAYMQSLFVGQGQR